MAKPKPCKRYNCEKDRNPERKDGYCTAKCKRADRWDDIRDRDRARSRVCNESGWF